jgi:phenylacetate-CoA ligase
VFTTLTKEALPLIRYRTGDLGRLVEEPCVCGRTTVRIAGLRGRLDDMLIVRGVNLYPSEVEDVLLSVEGVAPHYRLVLERLGPLDELRLECEPAGELDRSALAARLAALLKERTGLRIPVAVLDPGDIPPSEGKAVRVVDRRG